MYIKLPTEDLLKDETFIKLSSEFISAKLALTEYLNKMMDFTLEIEK